jgi:hypothetical protein
MPDQRNPDPDPELLEDVHYRVGYFGESRATEEAVVRAVARLPEDVREFACDQCRFISVGHALGYYLPGRVGLDPATDTTEGIWLILLADGQDPEDAESIVAHELAHLWLGHPLGTNSRDWLARTRSLRPDALLGLHRQRR